MALRKILNLRSASQGSRDPRKDAFFIGPEIA